MKIKLLTIFIFAFITINLFAPSVISAQQLQNSTNVPQKALGTNPQSYPLNTNPDVPKDLHSYMQVIFLEILSTVSCQVSGIDPIYQERSCLGATGKDGKIGFVQNGGAIGFLTKGIGSTFELPVSSGQYIASVFSDFGIVQKAEAQSNGIGFRGLLPFLSIWEAFRNITFLLFIIFFIIIGAGIMFQLKIDPRGIMTLQNQIPKIIIALLFITFSYAIAGFLIDLMYVAIYFSYGVISGIPGVDVSNLTPDKIQGSNPVTAANALSGSSFGVAAIASNATGAIVSVVKDVMGLGPSGAPDVANLPQIQSVGGFFGKILENIPGLSNITGLLSKIPGLGGFFNLIKGVGGGVLSTNYTMMNWIIHVISVATGLAAGIQIAQWQPPGGGAEGFSFGFNFLPGFLIGAPLGAIAGTAVTVITEVILREFLPNLIAFFIILVALFTALFRLWFLLIKAYIYLFFNIIFAPFWIAAGLIPGSSLGVGSWLKSTIANISVFPATYLMFLLGKALLDSINANPDNIFVPPLIGEVSSTSGSQFTALIGLGILLLTPEVVNMVRSAIKAPEFKFASSIGQSVMTGGGAAGAFPRRVGGELFGEDRMGRIRPGSELLGRKLGRFGVIARGLTGGGWRRNKKKDEDKGGTSSGTTGTGSLRGGFGSGGTSA